MLLGSKLVLISLQLYLERELVLAFPLFEPSLLQKTAARFYFYTSIIPLPKKLSGGGFGWSGTSVEIQLRSLKMSSI